MIRVLIADDHPVVRAGLRALLDPEPELLVVGEAATADEAVNRGGEVDVVLMDLRFGAGPGGAVATRRLREQPGGPHVLVLTNYDTDGDILGAVEAGASGYLLKDAGPEELFAAIRAAAAGETALAPTVAKRLLERVRRPDVSPTARELEVLRLVAEGLSNAEVAARLHVTEPTVKSHLVHVYTRLGVTSRTGAVAAARAAGLID
ncbi:Transcriptional regulatory protein liaR [Nostocoides japonicum T1-X7]|uniref:Transcriptional regulatory protein liaR n=1 Tax=Nostocoides japonicum T1-X7 TaxID=1194083 RepID=A0A077LX97_9MICO|nr:response regulator transcription factor [Tetrasphaera japonica]CCH78533.1 Transcriptional regulatory protein liaR [Tetrasphaera japonica T1-X7]